MEADIIIEGFYKCIETHGICLIKFVAGGDFIVFTKMKEKVLYHVQWSAKTI